MDVAVDPRCRSHLYSLALPYYRFVIVLAVRAATRRVPPRTFKRKGFGRQCRPAIRACLGRLTIWFHIDLGKGCYPAAMQRMERQMKPAKLLSLVISLSLLGTSTAFAASSVTGSAALALAGVVAAHSPKLSPAEKKAVAAFFDGKTDAPYSGKIKVTADRIVCRAGNVDITARSCEVTFAGETVSFRGREANELYATEVMAGVPSDGAAGSSFEGVTKLACTLDPAAIKDKGGGGAECSYEGN
jgi:hypothetical protein